MKEQTVKYDNFSDDVRAMMGISQHDFDLIKSHTIFLQRTPELSLNTSLKYCLNMSKHAPFSKRAAEILIG